MAFSVQALARNSAPVAFLLLVVAVTSCGPKQTESSLADPSASAGADSAQQIQVTGAQGTDGTNDAQGVAYGLASELQQSPFAAADPAVKETYGRALIAYDIGDYERAFSELNDLRAGGGLDQAQLQAIDELLGKTTTAAPELATNNAAASPVEMQADTFALAAENEPPFSTADPAVKETFARAKAAFDIGSYEVATAELQTLVTNTQLNWQQKYAAQSLLDKTPQPLLAPKR